MIQNFHGLTNVLMFKQYFEDWLLSIKKSDGRFSRTKKMHSYHTKHKNGLKLQCIKILEAIMSWASSQTHFEQKILSIPTWKLVNFHFVRVKLILSRNLGYNNNLTQNQKSFQYITKNVLCNGYVHTKFCNEPIL